MRYLILLGLLVSCGGVSRDQVSMAWKLCEGSSIHLIKATITTGVTEVYCEDNSYRVGATFPKDNIK